jgi:hypothetical protein
VPGALAQTPPRAALQLSPLPPAELARQIAKNDNRALAGKITAGVLAAMAVTGFTFTGLLYDAHPGCDPSERQYSDCRGIGPYAGLSLLGALVTLAGSAVAFSIGTGYQEQADRLRLQLLPAPTQGGGGLTLRGQF